MKKQFLAGAVAAALVAPAFAQNVQIFGVIDVSVSSVDAPTTTGAATSIGNPNQPGAGRGTGTGPGAWAAGTNINRGTVMSDGQMSSARWGIRGSEDLGGGLTALFYLESDIVTNSGATHSSGLFRRGAYAGLSSKALGELTVGRRIHPIIATTGALMPVSGNGVATPFSGGLGYSNGFFTSNAVTYTTPNLGGLVLQGQVGLSNDTTEATEGSVQGVSAAYTLGSFTVRGAYERRYGAAAGNSTVGAQASTATIASTDRSASVFGVQYRLNQQLTIGAATAQSASDTIAGVNIFNYSANLFGVGYQMTPALLLGANHMSGEGSTMTNLQARYALSKRSTLYAQYNNADNGSSIAWNPLSVNSHGTNQVDGSVGGSMAVLGAKQSSFGLGLMHSF